MTGITTDIARRYLFGKKSTNSINIITGISIFGISIGTAALILILSVFNGFEGLLSGLFNAFNPDVKVVPIKGKYFSVSDDQLLQIAELPGVDAVSKTIEEVALFEYKGIQELGKIKGVDKAFTKVTGLDTLTLEGAYRLEDKKIAYAYVGTGMRNKLSINVKDRLSPLIVYMPAKKKRMMGTKEFNSKTLYPGGVFSVKSDSDYQYVLASYDHVSQLMEKSGEVAALELQVTKANLKVLTPAIHGILGDNLKIKDRYQQDESFLKVMRIEKWISFLITGLTMLLIAFNLVGALWMIVVDKKKDISVFKALGFDAGHVRNLFLKLGLYITSLGIILGFAIALIFYALQKNYGLIAVPEGFLMDSYPVQIRMRDFVLVTITVLTIGWIASLLPARKASEDMGPLQLK